MGNFPANTNNAVQNLADRTKTASASFFVAPAAAELDIEATSGWQRVGVAESLNFQPNEAGIIDVMTGNPGTSKEKHIGTSSATFDITTKETQPIARDLANKTTLTFTAVPATTDFVSSTIAASGASLRILTLTDATDLAPGHRVAVPQGSGASAYTDYRFVKNVSTNTVTLEHELSEVPDDGTVVTRILRFDRYNGGKRLKEWSALIVASMNDDTVNAIKIPSFNVTGGQPQYNDPQSDIVKAQIAGGINAISVPINGVNEPVLSQEREYMPVIA